MDQPMQAQARLAMLIMPYHVPDFPCTLPRWLLPSQLAVTASGWWMVYYTASITLIHSSEGKPPARCPPRLLGCRGGRAADETEAARARRRVLTLGVEGG
jgi:hypothetical protein